MKDRLAWARQYNSIVENETQNLYRRFVESPLTGIPDYLGDTWRESGLAENRLLKNVYGDVMEEY